MVYSFKFAECRRGSDTASSMRLVCLYRPFAILVVVGVSAAPLIFIHNRRIKYAFSLKAENFLTFVTERL